MLKKQLSYYIEILHLSENENSILKNKERSALVLKALPEKIKKIEMAAELDKEMSLFRDEWIKSREQGEILSEETTNVLKDIEAVLAKTIKLDEENSILFVKRMQEESTENKEIKLPGQNAVKAMKAYGKDN